ncbi:MAG TPA: S9 family peptidase [Terriglobales bacterium]|nr:S9 family peptidase [Terriglobales bacterium]
MTATHVPQSLSAQPAEAPKPPVAEKVPKVDVVHGDQRVDDYYWLREKTNPEVRAYVEAENAYADAVLKPTAALREKLYKEMVGRIQETDVSVPYRKDGYLYYTRTEQGKQYPIYCRKGDQDAPEQVLLDLNEMARGHQYFAVSAFEVSDDGRYLAYSTDTTGFRVYTLYVKDLETDAIMPEHRDDVDTVAWAADNRTLFYTTKDSAKRPYRLWRQRLGANQDELLYEETDERFNVSVNRTRSRRYVFLTSASLTATEVRWLPANQPGGAWRLVAERRPGVEYYLDHRGDRFYIRTNDRGRNFRLAAAPVDDPRPENWQEIVPHRPDVMLDGMHFFRDFYVLEEREGGLPQLRVTDLRSGETQRVAFPEPAYEISTENNAEFEATAFRYLYESLVTPKSVFDYVVKKRESKLLKRTPVLGGYDPANYTSERIYATATDGTRIPISLVYRKGSKRDGKQPAYLLGYGAYGWAYPVTFNSNRVSLLDRGVLVAIAHIRGGGEMGKAWHDQGRMLQKRNTFTDFISAAEHLVREKYTSSDRLVIEGTSAGGLLMGAVTNMRPDLFKAVIARVPFVDAINTMLDSSLPLTVPEFEEWGNPAKPDEYAYMKSYCPYTNLAAKDYPAMFVRSSFNDSQVMYWEPTKCVAKMRSLRTDKNPLLLHTLIEAGHGGASGRYDYLRELTYEYSFLLWQVGIPE